MTVLDGRVGLCSVCANVRRVPGERSTFYLCELAFRDARFRKYPALPVLRCDGFEGDRPKEGQ
ncbi:MAG: hypothetical protein ABI577_16505 [bacterium]